MLRTGEETMPKVRTLIADDEPLSREWIRSGVADDAELGIVAECVNALEMYHAMLALIKDLQRERSYREWLLLREEGKSFFVQFKDIDWIESARNNILLHVRKQKHVCHETTSRIEGRLDPRKFLRIHRS